MTTVAPISSQHVPQVRLMCLATHHKGGTVWMKQIIKALAVECNIPWIGIWSDAQVQNIPEAGPAFLVNWHGWFPSSVWDRDDIAVLHIIRDPRDILLSGCEYHHHAGKKGEEFLHTPRQDLGGRTYQQTIASIDGLEDKLLFEMREKHSETLSEMRLWPYDHPASMTLRYEDLMNDTTGDLFRSAMVHWGLAPHEQDIAVSIFLEKSLFAENKDRSLRAGHVQSGETMRWRKELPYAVGKVYAREFGNDLIELGYEATLDWAQAMQGDVH